MRRRKSTLQSRVNKTRCPCCRKYFINILCHLNHQQSKCANWFDDISSLHHPPQHNDNYSLEDPAAIHPEPTPHGHLAESSCEPTTPSTQQSLYHVKFSGAGATFGRTETFMDRFNSDKYSGSRVDNIYYPFAGKDEWELGSFLHSSGLSMRKIDDFLRLKMVITNHFGHSHSLITKSRSGMLVYPSPQRRRSMVGWKFSLRSLIGGQRRLPSQVTQRVNRCISSIATLSTVSSTSSGTRYLQTIWTSAPFACIRMQNKPSACTASG